MKYLFIAMFMVSFKFILELNAHISMVNFTSTCFLWKQQVVRKNGFNDKRNNKRRASTTR